MGKGRGGAVALLAAALLLTQLPQAALAASPWSATYSATVPSSLAAGLVTTLAVAVANTGANAWDAGGANPVSLSYHWYDASGRVVVWDGLRTGLGVDFAAGTSRTMLARVEAPKTPGSYQLRFAMVKEGLLWFEPSASHAVAIAPPYAATFVNVAPLKLATDAVARLAVTVTNTGVATWNASGSQPVGLSYHWYDATGRVVVWDGLRTSLGADLAPGASRTLNATVRAPAAQGTYTLAFDMVKEGALWFDTPHRVSATIEPARYTATYSIAATSLAFIGETRTVPVVVTNTGNVTWNGAPPAQVNLSYHLYRSDGQLLTWDGARAALGGDLAPGASRTLQLPVLMPTRPGSYSVRIDLVREGVAWFSSLGTPPASLAVQVESGYAAEYANDTTPSSIATGAVLPISLKLTNTGQRPWLASGTSPVRVAYHWYDAFGRIVLWDGTRTSLPADVAPGSFITLDVMVTAPTASGTFRLDFDLVQDGIAWFSDVGVAPYKRTLSVFPGVTFYGKGWGHGVGMSQWGAQGWATGVAGTRLTGEQIAQRYFPGAQITPLSNPRPFRVLLSAPSTGCNARTVYGVAHLRSDGGLKVVRGTDGVVVAQVGPGTTARVVARGTIIVTNLGNGVVVYNAPGHVFVEPLDATKPITVDEKARFYRGKLSFELREWDALRVLNHVHPDEYTRGAVPAEMPSGWHLEAYKAQAYAARTYALWRQQSNAGNTFDLRDDTSDQCYGGASVETILGNEAGAATAGKVLTHNGAVVAAYYHSSDGGAIERNGCVWNLVKVGGRWACGNSYEYLQVVQDPADLLAYDPRGPNPQRSWTRTVTGPEIRSAVLFQSGIDIGGFISIDLSNRGGSGHVISVFVRGTAATVEVRGDEFLRTQLGLKSTMVRTQPF